MISSPRLEDEGLLLVCDGADWVGTTPAALQNLALLGLGTTADASNPFSARLNAALWSARTVAEGGTGDLFHTMNKDGVAADHGAAQRRDTVELQGYFRAQDGYFAADYTSLWGCKLG